MTKLGAQYQELVGEVRRALDPGSEVEVGQWIEGPDGEREVDVIVRGSKDGSGKLVIIECKDWRRPVDVQTIDAFDSKRRDLAATEALICSNSGFTSTALLKSQRVGIGAISVLASGDSRVKLRVKTVLVADTRSIDSYSVILYPHDPATDSIPDVWSHERVFMMGGPVINWLSKESKELVASLEQSCDFLARYDFASTQDALVESAEVRLAAVGLRGRFSRQWLGQRVCVDVTKGIFDQLADRVIVPSGQGYMLGWIGRDAWEPVDAPEEVGNDEPNSFTVSVSLVNPIRAIDGAATPDLDSVVASKTVSTTEIEFGGAV